MSFLDRARTVAPPGYNRWLIPPAALAVHLSIGQVYAFSVFKQPLVDHFGSSLTATGVIFSISIAGLATGLAIMGFGGGALIASPLSNTLLESFASQPQHAIVPAFLTLAAIYFVAMMLGAVTVRVPADDWVPEGWTPPSEEESDRLRTTGDVTAASAIRTPQFWLLWTVLFCNVTAGIGILEQASPMIQDFFGDVNAAQAAGFVGLLSLANMAGRFLWSSTSDAIGRKPMYMAYLGVGAILYFALAASGTAGLGLFLAVTVVIISFYGGGFATIPAYLKDLFGGHEVGAIHGRLLTAWAAAGVAGPLIVNGIADSQTAAGKEGAALYELSLFIMVGVLVVGFIANLLVRPVSERFHLSSTERDTEPSPRRRGLATSEPREA